MQATTMKWLKATGSVFLVLLIITLVACGVSYLLYITHIANLDPAMLTIAGAIIDFTMNGRRA